MLRPPHYRMSRSDFIFYCAYDCFAGVLWHRQYLLSVPDLSPNLSTSHLAVTTPTYTFSDITNRGCIIGEKYST